MDKVQAGRKHGAGRYNSILNYDDQACPRQVMIEPAIHGTAGAALFATH
jgi:hypothetical protein